MLIHCKSSTPLHAYASVIKRLPEACTSKPVHRLTRSFTAYWHLQIIHVYVAAACIPYAIGLLVVLFSINTYLSLSSILCADHHKLVHSSLLRKFCNCSHTAMHIHTYIRIYIYMHAWSIAVALRHAYRPDAID
jgi:hypothetical protein